MAIVNGTTRTGYRPSSGVVDADFSAYKAVVLATTASPDDNAIPYTLSTTADLVPYGILGNKDDNPEGKRDTLIVEGVVPVQLNVAYTDALRGQGIVTHTVKGVCKAQATGGLGVIVNGGTEIITNPSTGAESTVNVAYVDLRG